MSDLKGTEGNACLKKQGGAWSLSTAMPGISPCIFWGQFRLLPHASAKNLAMGWSLPTCCDAAAAAQRPVSIPLAAVRHAATTSGLPASCAVHLEPCKLCSCRLSLVSSAGLLVASTSPLF